MTKIIVYDNLKLVGACVESILNNMKSAEVTGRYDKPSPLVSILRSGLEADLVLLRMESLGNDELGWIKTIAESTDIPLLLLCDTLSLAGIKDAFRCGVKGCLAMTDEVFEVECAVTRLSQGYQYLSSDFALSTMDYWPADEHLSLIKFSPREVEILKHIASGLTNEEIADIICTSKRTVEGHRHKLIKKTGANNTAELIVKTMRLHVLD